MLTWFSHKLAPNTSPVRASVFSLWFGDDLSYAISFVNIAGFSQDVVSVCASVSSHDPLFSPVLGLSVPSASVTDSFSCLQSYMYTSCESQLTSLLLWAGQGSWAGLYPGAHRALCTAGKGSRQGGLAELKQNVQQCTHHKTVAVQRIQTK